MVNEPESTLKPAEVARLMVRQAISKHNDRYENVFFKAVSFNKLISCLYIINERSL